jgi:hypothetical protein
MILTNMERVITIAFKRQKNDEHFQFHAAFRRLVYEFGADALNIESQFKFHSELYIEENEALKKIVINTFSKDIHKTNRMRELLFSHLVKRDELAATKDEIALKQARLQTDSAYQNIVALVETTSLIERSETHKNFIAKLNVIIEIYNHAMDNGQLKIEN